MGRRGALAAAAATTGAVMVGLSAPAAWASNGGSAGGGSRSSGSSAADAPAGNNGHIQIDEYAMDGGNGNDPHVGCGFSISFFGYDTGTRTASVSVTPWAPTRGGTPFHSGALTWQVSQRRGGNQLDFNYPVSPATVAGIFHDVTPAHQGYHARVEVEVNGSQGSDDKYKMVWIAPCATMGTGPSSPSGVAGSSQSGPSGSPSAGGASTSGLNASLRPAGAAGPSTTATGFNGQTAGAGRVVAAGASTPVAVLGESVSRPLAAAPAGTSTPTPGGLPFTGADIALESLVSLGLVGTGAFLTRRYRLKRH